MQEDAGGDFWGPEKAHIWELGRKCELGCSIVLLLRYHVLLQLEHCGLVPYLNSQLTG